MGRKNKNTPITNRQDHNRQHMAKIKHDKLLKTKLNTYNIFLTLQKSSIVTFLHHKKKKPCIHSNNTLYL
jgi:hypothetical protein